ncbi:MAG: hypothetical protein HY862_11905 [Chloroflexi bacterium]|nr:hypothetical protein [Chloroflexota bacterium]
MIGCLASELQKPEGVLGALIGLFFLLEYVTRIPRKKRETREKRETRARSKQGQASS